ncbi:hypothetical protein [Pseudofrankia sp. BMG5.37]|uniref:hypothetical protein n=1 Tax=Pseudofrankia sp. BMG5.37 TaxID=3050035 RepID=UPI00289515FC|nr:hypothetical protein [Pseudofrankia sp. BMG5.37]MDT3445944.1 hypothetical protein [Pseudofrankia sp. BMG5.37]
MTQSSQQNTQQTSPIGSAGPAGTSPRAQPEPGTLAQEAALLTAAVREWLTAHGAPPAPARAGAADDPEAEDAAADWPGTAEDAWGPSGPEDQWDARQDPAGAYPPGVAQGDPFDQEQGDGPTPGPGPRHGPPWAVGPGETLCTGCPLCRLLASVAGSHAEVLGHLLAAASSLAAAARAAWPPAGGPGQGTGDQHDDPPGWQASPRQTATQQTRPARGRVQRIDIGE